MTIERICNVWRWAEWRGLMVGCFMVASLVACDSDSDGDTSDTEKPSSLCGVPDPELAEMDADELFNWAHVPAFDIYLPPERWEKLQEEATLEEYVEAEACFEGRAIGKVGLRFKGSYGSLLNCFDEEGNNSCRKLGMKLKFSEYDKENRFFGLKRLNFQGNRYDDSYMREKLAYDLYREMDIVAPRVSWAEVRVNDELQGLFGMVEQIDGRFTDDRWPESGDGNLYKEVWPITTDEESILYHLKTNEDEAELSSFISFAEAMNAADEDELRSTLGEYMDLDYLARYMAVDDAIANYDGITAYYATEDVSWAGNHNFYIYEEEADDFTLIPWDLESTFNASGFGNVPRWTDVPEDCDVTYNAWGQADLFVIAPGCDRIFRAMAQDLESYRTAGETLLSEAFSEAAMSDAIDEHIAFIREAAEADPNGPGLTAFESAAEDIRNRIPMLRTRFEYLLSGESWVPFELPPDDVMDFEEQDDLGLIMGPEIYMNPTSTADFSINTDDPIQGEQSLFISFEFANGTDPWDQWLIYIVPFKGGIHDVSDLSGIRFRARADAERTLRLEINTTLVSEDNGWLRNGWDVPIDDEADQFEVYFDDAAVPLWASDQGLDPGAPMADVLKNATGILFQPVCTGLNDHGYLPDETTDEGFVELDDIEFF
jgi:spore coat protein H